MRLKSMIASIGVAGIVLAPLPALAQAEEEAAGALAVESGIGGYVIPLLAISAVLGGVAIAVTQDNNTPTSP